MKSILVPVDFSKFSEYALEVSANIAKKLNWEIVVVHMMGLSDSLLTKNEEDEFTKAMYAMKVTQKNFQNFLNKDYLEGIKVTETIRKYKDFKELNNVAMEFESDLIVMGSHGISGFKEIFVSTNTEKVIRTSSVPVLVIKESIRNFGIQKAVVACDLETESVKAIRKTIDFLSHYECNIQLLYINRSEIFLNEVEIKITISKFLNLLERDISTEDVVVYDDYTVENGIFSYCYPRNIDLIVMPTHRRKGLSHFIFGSQTSEIANHAEIPVLTLKI